jgi:hypothetical protein
MLRPPNKDGLINLPAGRQVACGELVRRYASSSVGCAELSRLGGIGCLLQPGQFHRDTKHSSFYRDFAKTPAYRQVGMPTLTRTATQLNRRAVDSKQKNDDYSPVKYGNYTSFSGI